jgi:anti-anti-sigma regulatory factor
MSELNTILATFDAARNLVRLSFLGDIGVEESRRCEAAISDVIAASRPGFSLLTDLSQLNSMDAGCIPYIARLMDLARGRGIALVVRIIPDRSKDIGFSILSLFHYPQDVRVITCDSKAEADGALQ